MRGMNDKYKSLKKQQNISSKTPVKNGNRTYLTAQKYLNAKLEYSQKKKISIQKVVGQKQERIRQLQSQVIQNQQLVKQTLRKWNDYRQKVQKQKQRQIIEVQHQVRNIKESFQVTERNMNEKYEQNKRLRQQNQILKFKNKEIQQKYETLFQKYKADKKQWKEVCQYIAYITQGMQKLPINILQKYFS